MYMVGFASSKFCNTYCLYNPVTKQIIESRNVRWGEWPTITSIPIKGPLEPVGEEVDMPALPMNPTTIPQNILRPPTIPQPPATNSQPANTPPSTPNRDPFDL